MDIRKKFLFGIKKTVSNALKENRYERDEYIYKNGALFDGREIQIPYRNENGYAEFFVKVVITLEEYED
jgi:hypothetical protein